MIPSSNSPHNRSSKETSMKSFQRLICATVLCGAAAIGAGCAHQNRTAADSGATADQSGFARDFNVPKENFTSTGRNDFFILEPGYQLVLTGKDEGRSA